MTKAKKCVAVLLLVAASSCVATALAAGDGPVPAGPNPIYDAADYSTKIGSVPNGVIYRVSAPYETGINVVHLFGNTTERGYAYGQLMRTEVLNFNAAMEDFFRDEVNQIPLGGLPQWLQKIIIGAGRALAPSAFKAALEYVYKVQLPFTTASKADVWTEVHAIAEGVCSNATGEDECSVSEIESTLQRLNMLPDLIRMQCSMMGAWGPATPAGKLVQLRSLDFGGGPFADASVLVVHHPPSPEFAFASLSFPGFVGSVTGFSEKIGLSEKVDDVTGGKQPHGTYKGQAVSLVIRDILQFAKSKDEAVSIAQKANRTWPVWLGFGDFESEEFVAVGYSEAAATPYDDKTLPKETNQTAFTGVAYIDKHPQPSPHTTMPELVKKFYGNISARTVAQYFPRLMESGDVHTAVYDFGENPTTYIALGKTNSTGSYSRKAYESPFMAFNQAALWSEQPPTQH